MLLKNKIAIVTGAGQGIGRGISMELADEGAKVIATDIEETLALQTTGMIIRKGGISTGYKMDVTNSSDVEFVVGRVKNEFSRIDILVNNAGINIPMSVIEMTENIWDKVIAVNLKGVFLCSREVAKIMAKQNSGRIINISSVAGKIGAPGLGAYCATKRGILGLTEVLAIELGKYGICVNAVCPGNTETEMILNVLNERAKKRGRTLDYEMQEIKNKTPLGRMGKPEDIGRVIAFLASHYSSYITGQAISVCGGRSINLS